VAIYLISGSDERLISAQLTELVNQLIGDLDRATMYESHDVDAAATDERDRAVRNAVMGCETPSLFGDTRVVVMRGIQEATVDQLTPLIEYLRNPAETSHLVLTSSGKLAKSTTDALKKAGATTMATSPPSRRNELNVWFQEQFAHTGLKLGVASAIALLARADLDLRGGRDLPEELTMEILVARLCKMGGPTSRSTKRR